MGMAETLAHSAATVLLGLVIPIPNGCLLSRTGRQHDLYHGFPYVAGTAKIGGQEIWWRRKRVVGIVLSVLHNNSASVS